jgi:hypothetical protein
VDKALSDFPSGDAIMGRLESHIREQMPDKDKIQAEFHEMMVTKLESFVSKEELKEALVALLPQTEAILSAIRDSLPDKARFQDTLTRSLADAVRDSLPERVWLESVSRGLFDERTRGVLPNREEVVTLMREEIQSQLFNAVEKIVKQQIERIASDLVM